MLRPVRRMGHFLRQCAFRARSDKTRLFFQFFAAHLQFGFFACAAFRSYFPKYEKIAKKSKMLDFFIWQMLK